MANQWQGQKYSHIASATTTLVNSGPTFLHSININTTAAGAMTVYDGLDAGGTVVAIFPSSATVGTRQYNIKLGVGLTIVTAAAYDVTVAYL